MLEGSEHAQNARLGSALAPIPDMNGDGWSELVVGAPLEDDHQGAVYVFYGKRDRIQKKYRQVQMVDRSIDIQIYLYLYTVIISHDVDSEFNYRCWYSSLLGTYSVCLPTCLGVCLPAYLPVCLSASLSVCLSVCLPVCLCVCLPPCLSVCLSTCLCVSLSAPLCLCRGSRRSPWGPVCSTWVSVSTGSWT